ncbi:FecR domain-containing protein [Flavitalea sp. BT771]|uniref:FecR domain-containing protein n=1 Tax=Flavitalea sp. BT771 TaxID=3063329 RepID=UPI0026E39B81|nr:FecR domain-containing protein [Flavitalea sp. BT771]MDO6433201.1 FecR domain-containing protein [Flavitalea sp. BT771]MDV6221523.1 FecR domain-containing protein [Flavitalea sp. BT771]
MQEERFTILASLYLSGEASPSEREELEALLRNHPEWESKWTALRRIWLSKQQGLTKKEDAYQRHLQRLTAHIDANALPTNTTQAGQTAETTSAAQTSSTGQTTSTTQTIQTTLTKTTRKPRLRKLFIASAVAASLAGAILLIRPVINTPKNPPITKTVTTNPGARSRLTLPDGTSVVLNADSRLTYNEDFTGDTRDIQLSGEAYFDVAKDPHRPFLIHTKTIDIKVLGTAFNVRSYDNERTTETDLLQGAVEVTLHNTPDKRIILKPNEKLTVHNDQVNLSTSQPIAAGNPDAPLITVGKVHFQKKDSSITEILWTKNCLAFDNSSLEDVALQMQRWFGITVTIPDEKLKSLRLNAYFEKENLRQVMEALSIAGNFKYTIRKNEVIIGP